jgi:hypothetical protein
MGIGVFEALDRRSRRKGRDMSKKGLLAAVFCAAALAGGPSAALAGEVKGPPNDPPNSTTGTGGPTAAPEHSNSICSFSGLNDGNPPGGQVQSYGQDVKAGLADPHQFNPGDACQGGSNPRNP